MRGVVKQVIRNAFKKHGYLVAKYPFVAFRPVPVFDLAVQLLMASRGTACTFVEVGANDGRFADPLYKYVVDFPWRGILVEPQRDVFERLRSNYELAADRLIFENVAIGNHGDRLTLYRACGTRADEAVYASSVVSSNPALVAAQLKTASSRLEPFTVPCMSLDALLAKHGWTRFDLLVLDTEGNDLEVLESLDLRQCRPLIIQLESGHLSPAKIDRAVAYLAGNGYRVLYGGYQMDTIAVHETFLGIVGSSLASAHA